MPNRPTVDSKVPRAKAFVHAALPSLAFLLGDPVAPYLLAVTGAIMALSVVGGPRFSLFGRLFHSLRPILNIEPGRLEDPRPHRFAEAIGAVFLVAAAIFYWTGPQVAGQILSLAVSALALLNAVGGICVGCQMYLLFRRPSAFSRPESGGAA